MTLQDRLRQVSSFYIDGRKCLSGNQHVTWADESAQAADRIDALEIAMHRIAGHGNITIEQAKAIAAESLDANKPGTPAA